MSEGLRDIVTAAASRGLRGRRRPSRRNPHYQPPTETEAAWSHLYGEARAFREWATAGNIELALAGLKEREDPQVANVRAVRECADIFRRVADVVEASTTNKVVPWA